MGPLSFSVTVDGMVVVGCECCVDGLWSYDFEVGFFFRRLFLFGAGWCEGRAVLN